MNEQVKKAVESRIESIETQKDFDMALNIYETSESELKHEAISMLKRAFPLFCKKESGIYGEAMTQILESQADISNIN